ncbi:MAG: PilZ domain-containing protein [Phycisphaerales bacterium]
MGTPCRISDFEYDTDAPAPLRFERRAHDRWPMEGVATAVRLGGERFGQMQVLKMIDYSWEGLGAFCPEPLEPGTIVSLGFQEPGYVAKRGVVLRCLPCGDGYRAAIQFESLLAA